ncbi:hypothetical protein Tco_0244112, partial [Tanacetum coccineum]
RNDEEANQEERNPNDDHGIGNFDNDLVPDNAPYHANKEEEQYEEDKCELLGNPYQEPPVCKIRRTEEDACHTPPRRKHEAKHYGYNHNTMVSTTERTK